MSERLLSDFMQRSERKFGAQKARLVPCNKSKHHAHHPEGEKCPDCGPEPVRSKTESRRAEYVPGLLGYEIHKEFRDTGAPYLAQLFHGLSDEAAAALFRSMYPGPMAGTAPGHLADLVDDYYAQQADIDAQNIVGYSP